MLHLRVPIETNLSGLLISAIDLNYLPNDTSHEIVQLRGRYNYEKITDDLSDAVNRELHSNNIEQALEVVDVCLMDIHKSNQIKKVIVTHKVSCKMEDANKAFDDYTNTFGDPLSTDNLVNIKLGYYLYARKALTENMINDDAKKWSDVIKKSDAKCFWSYVDWKGNVKQQKEVTSPNLHEFESFFQDLYKCNGVV